MRWGRAALILPPYLWLFVLFFLPFLVVLRISLSDAIYAIPPYAPQWEDGTGMAGLWAMVSAWDLDNYRYLASDLLYIKAYLSSLQIAITATALTLAISYPIAYAMARAPQGLRPYLMMAVVLPFFSSFLIRVYAWIALLSENGLINGTLQSFGLIDAPLQILGTNVAVYIGIVYTYAPFMILPIYASLERMDHSLLEAAEDLGANRREAFWLVTWPLSRPGVIAGCFLVFIPVVGEFVIPSLLGGSETLMIGKVLWDEFSANRDWPLASAVAVLLLLILVVPIMAFQHFASRESN